MKNLFISLLSNLMIFSATAVLADTSPNPLKILLIIGFSLSLTEK